MAAVQASVALTTARTLLNDDAASLWTDTALMPKLAQAHRELQNLLKSSAANVLKVFSSDIPVNAGDSVISLPSNLVEPITLWERLSTDPATANVPMTEVGFLPFNAQQAAIVFWTWTAESINIIAPTTNRLVKMQYWRSLTVPTVNTDSIGFISGELYLAPRIAALAAGSVGDDNLMKWASQVADEQISKVILANRGRLKPADGTVARP